LTLPLLESVAPHPDDDLSTPEALLAARAQAYDLVYNGVEVGGGSLRIYRRVQPSGGAAWRAYTLDLDLHAARHWRVAVGGMGLAHERAVHARLPDQIVAE